MGFDNPFLSRLHVEKLAGQSRRGSLVTRKLAWISGLLAVGSIRYEQELNLIVVLWIVPLIATIFDLYIIGENYGVKRMGVFVRNQLNSTLDGRWEEWIKTRRDRFSLHALPNSSLIALIGCAGVLWVAGARAVWYRSLLVLWLVGNVTLIRLVYVLGVLSMEALDAGKDDAAHHWLTVAKRFVRIGRRGGRPDAQS